MIRNLGAIIIDSLRHRFIEQAFDQLEKKERLLDLGCGVKPFQPIYDKKVKESFGIEVETTLHDQSRVDKFYDGRNIPFSDASFDVVFSTEVMEHVPDPNHFLSEIHRVLKKDGIAILTVPFFVPLHEQPHDYYRYTSFGLEHLVKTNGFAMKKMEVFGDYIAVITSLLIIPHLKFWNVVAKKTRLNFLRSIFNPVIFIFIYLPQVIYLKLSKIKVINKLLKKSQYVPKGYGLIIQKTAL